MVVYRDCNGLAAPLTPSLTTDIPGYASIPLTAVSSADVSPAGPGCPTCTNSFPNGRPTEQIIYESAAITLSGTPSSAGWNLTFTDCCSPDVTNMNPGMFYLHSVMHSFNGSMSPCLDNAPEFPEPPLFGFTTTAAALDLQTAFDTDRDSLTYDWGNDPALNFASGYSYNSPLPGITQDPLNIPAVLDANSGEISFKSYTTGLFQYHIKVSSYKCGQLVSEIMRQITTTLRLNELSPGIVNETPVVTVHPNRLDTSIYAGTPLNVTFDAFDYDALPPPNQNMFQSIKFEVYSPWFGSPCLIPPCASMSPSNTIGQFFSGAAATNLTWQTACAHASTTGLCMEHARTYDFIVRVFDNYCPFPGVTSKLMKVTVHGPEITVNGNILEVNPATGTFQWYLNGNPIAGATASTYTPVISGNYAVISTNGTGCSMISNTVLRTGVGLNDYSDKITSVSVSPNPATVNTQAMLSLNNFSHGQIIISLTDENGKLIQHNTVVTSAGNEMIMLNLNGLNPGLYTINAQSETATKNTKLIIR